MYDKANEGDHGELRTVSYLGLMEEIDQFSDVPLYRQLAQILRGQIEAGELARLDPLPSEKDLQQVYGVSRDTVRAAMAALRADDVVFTIPQRGTFVGPRP